MDRETIPTTTNESSVKETTEIAPLFRNRALQRTGQRLPGPVSVVTPPTLGYALTTAMLCIFLLSLALYLVEIPLRTRAVGVLMPAGGILEIASSAQGRISEILVSEGDEVVQGQLLVTMSSDRGSEKAPSLVGSQLKSLQNELTIVDRSRRENEKLQQALAADLRVQLSIMARRSKLAKRDAQVISARVALLAGRVHRLESLGDRGSLSPDSIEQVRSEYLSAEHDQIMAQRAIVELDLERQQLTAVDARAKIERVIQSLVDDSQSERLRRLIDEKSVEQRQRVLSPTHGEVIRLDVRVGSVIAAGRTLLSIASDATEIEAWLYVSAHEAGVLRPGQEIELQLDAYPHQLFGTVPAEISSVTQLAVLPREVRAPIALAGPVFEVRASLKKSIQGRIGANALPGIGASFTADIIRHRYRLYEWLFRSRAAMFDSGRA